MTGATIAVFVFDAERAQAMLILLEENCTYLLLENGKQ